MPTADKEDLLIDAATDALKDLSGYLKAQTANAQAQADTWRTFKESADPAFKALLARMLGEIPTDSGTH